jgi:hypothetical protein
MKTILPQLNLIKDQLNKLIATTTTKLLAEFNLINPIKSINLGMKIL